MKVKIPFMERFKEPMLNETKTMTSRSKKYGDVGDTFDAFGVTFEITNVGRLQLGDIASFWKEEGMISIEDFWKTWSKIHPIKDRMSDYFYYHRFRKAV